VNNSVHKFLKEHRTVARWLDDIIDVLLRFRGTAHVNTIARELAKSYDRDIETMEQTVTRRINDFCSDAQDWKKSKDYDLFERVKPGTYRLRCCPDRPNIIELVRIQFEESKMQYLWSWFSELAQKKTPKRWAEAKNEKRLEAFIKWISKDEVDLEYERRMAAVLEIDLSDLELPGLLVEVQPK
jgi:hypothetical protein